MINVSLFICLFTPLFLGGLLILGRKLLSSVILFFMHPFIFSIMFISLLIFTYSFLDFRNNLHIKLFDAVCFENYKITFDLYFNIITVIMFFVVFVISYLVSLFAIWYMQNDPNIAKFISYISFFSFFMLILVCANNIVLLFVGWEGIGLFSYLLISFWKTRVNTLKSALKAIAINKIGDCFFYLFIAAYWSTYNTFSIYQTNISSSIIKFDVTWFGLSTDVIMISTLVVASVAKSAQIILHVWLPDAMEGPTPVSALLHAATMVTAGIYVLIKFNFLLEHNKDLYNLIVNIGLATNFLASFIAIFQNDIKKIIAYSTASQIGIIFMSFGLLKFEIALFHIFNHAYFKAFLFILAGVIIHYISNKQDLRLFRTLNKDKFMIYVCFLVCSFSLMSVPFFSGYYSKEIIIQSAYINSQFAGLIPFYFLNISAVTTSIYSFKILYFLFFSENSFIIHTSGHFYKKNLSEVTYGKTDFLSILLYVVCIILTICSAAGGFIFSYFLSFSALNLATDYVDFLLQEENMTLCVFNEVSSLLLFYFVISGIYLFIWIRIIFKRNSIVRNVSSKKFFFNDIYNSLSTFFIALNYITCDFFDKEFVENSVIRSEFTITGLVRNFKSFYAAYKHTVILNFIGIFQLIFILISFCDLKTLFILYYSYLLSQYILEIIYHKEITSSKSNIDSHNNSKNLGFNLYIDYVKNFSRIKHKAVFEQWKKDSETQNVIFNVSEDSNLQLKENERQK